MPDPPSAASPRTRSFVSGFLVGFRAFLRAPGVLTRHRLWHYQIIPGLISIVLTLAVLAAAFFSAKHFALWLDEKIVIPWEWLDDTVTWSIGIITAIAWLAAFLFLHKQLALVVLAPFLGRLAELTVRGVEGKAYQQRLTPVQSIKRAAQINLGSILKEIGLTLGFVISGFLPVVGPVFSVTGLFLTESRFLGFGLMDFPLEYRGLTVAESRRFARERAGIATGLGAGYLLLMAIPFVGWMFAPTFGTVAGTIEALDELKPHPSPDPDS